MVAIGTRKLAAVTVLPLTTRLPVTWLVRPTAMLFWPRRTSFTRYPARDPAATCQVPPSDAAVVPACPAASNQRSQRSGRRDGTAASSGAAGTGGGVIGPGPPSGTAGGTGSHEHAAARCARARLFF